MIWPQTSATPPITPFHSLHHAQNVLPFLKCTMAFHTTVPFFVWKISPSLPMPGLFSTHYFPQCSHTFKTQLKYQHPCDAFPNSLTQFIALFSMFSLHLVHNATKAHILLIALSLERLFPSLNANTLRAKFRVRGTSRESLRERNGQVTKDSSIGTMCAH